MEAGTMSPEPLRSPEAAERSLLRLRSRAELLQQQRARVTSQQSAFKQQLEFAPVVKDLLDQLSDQVFRQLIERVEVSLTRALQDVLQQPIRLRVESRLQNNATAVQFSIERNGEREDVARGQGGSVANILSVGLRIFAIDEMSHESHRRFIVLDEQDCWLQPELVPRLVKIVKEASEQLNFQVLMISHHDIEMFSEYADRIYTLEPQADGSVVARQRDAEPAE